VLVSPTVLAAGDGAVRMHFGVGVGGMRPAGHFGTREQISAPQTAPVRQLVWVNGW